MKRRNFIASGLRVLAGAILTRGAFAKGEEKMIGTIPKRIYQPGVELSIIGFGGIVVVGMEQKQANRVVADSFEKGIDYFDVAPSYWDGEAEAKLGKALQPIRHKIFLACKTMERSAQGSAHELEMSLKRIETDHFDLYQFHAVTQIEEVEQIFAPHGALETFVKARQEGKIRFIGFSAHSEDAALALLDRFKFDSVLFPINYVSFAQGNFGPRVIARAKEKGAARLAFKAMAYTPIPEGAKKKYEKCWYIPVDDEKIAEKALRFSLSEDITAAIPPGDERLYDMALRIAANFKPLTNEERSGLLAETKGLKPLFPLS